MQADEYRRMYEAEDAYWWFVSRRRLAHRWLASSGRVEGPLLDLGCGTGAGLRDFADLTTPAGEVVGLDYSAEALAFARGRGFCTLVNGDAQALPFRDASFGGAVTLDMLEHVRDHERAARELFRVLKPDASLVVNVPAYRWLWSGHDAALMHHRRYSRGELVNLLEGAGFEIVRASYTMFLLFPVVVAQRLVSRTLGLRGGAAVPHVSPGVNRALLSLLAREERVLDSRSLPWGSSVTALARKPPLRQNDAPAFDKAGASSRFR